VKGRGAVGETAVTGTAAVRTGEPVRRRIDHDVQDTLRRDPLFAGSCYLCGMPISRGAIFCYAHKWAGASR